MTDKLIVFTRYPVAGVTKTRLIDHLGAQGAADLQRLMTEKVLDEAGKHPADLEVRFYGGTLPEVENWLGKNLCCREQGNGDLGEKLARAFAESFTEGYRKVVIIGADCPEITPEIIDTAFNVLSHHDPVIGPASDGGYYLIGLTTPHPELFIDQPWGSNTLLQNTLTVAENLRLEYHLLDELHDVDLPEDLERIKPLIRDLKPVLSVIVPTLNEEDSLAETLTQLSSEPYLEVIVADGGSIDRTTSIAADHGARVVESPAGRGAQQNAGVAEANGDTLLFLHADTILPGNFRQIILACLEKPGVIAGAFTLSINTTRAGIRLVEKGANFRSRVFQMPYGDQAIFIRKDRFEMAGGFPEIEIMEDFALVRKLRGIGKVETLDIAVRTSGRRWQNKGVLKTTLINQAMIIGYLMGFSPASLASWYRSSSRASS